MSTPTGLMLHGVVQHQEHVERWWFRDVFGGEEGLPYAWTDEDPDGEWHVPAEVPMGQLLIDYADESARCDAVIHAASSLDAVSVWRDFSLRWILMHLVEETSRHVGHIDLLREQADGAAGEEPGAELRPACAQPLLPVGCLRHNRTHVREIAHRHSGEAAPGDTAASRGPRVLGRRTARQGVRRERPSE